MVGMSMGTLVEALHTLREIRDILKAIRGTLQDQLNEDRKR